MTITEIDKQFIEKKKTDLNVKDWEKFKIGDLFTVYTGGDKPKKNDPEHKDGVLVNSIENLTKNNGVKGKILYNGDKKFKNFISVVSIGGGGHAFYQSELGAIFTRVKALVPKKYTKLNENIAMFIVTVLQLEKIKYSYGRVLDSDRLSNAIIKLPVNDKGLPDWDFMENYIINIMNKISKKVSITDKPFYEQKLKLTDKIWKPFRYDSLFVIERGEGARKKDIKKNGKTPFITSTDKNNGVTGMVDISPTHQGTVITVNRNGSVGEAFYQPIPFCSTEDVHVFVPKFELNPYTAMFLICLIRKQRFRYSYGRKWGLDRMNETVIMLPVNDKDQPDWKFMEDYIKSLPYSSNL